MKKWLSYRERDVLGRALLSDEAHYVTQIIQRIAAVLLLEQALNTNYEVVKRAALPWNMPEATTAQQAVLDHV